MLWARSHHRDPILLRRGPGEATGRVIEVLLIGLLIRLAYVKLINRNAILWTASIVAIAVVLTAMTSLQEIASL